MADNTGIEWTDATWNPWRGCTKVSEGCKHCYAETLAKRNPKVLGMWGPMGTRAPASESYWQQPLRWNKQAQEAGERRRVFCASLADVFEGPETCQDHGSYVTIQQARRRLWDEIIPNTPQLDWLLLTKRPENILRFTPGIWETDWPANVWVGTSVEDQAAADKRIPELLKVPAPVRFLSVEPLLGPVDLTNVSAARDETPDYLDCLAGETHSSHGRAPHEFGRIQWVIVGGESGPNARPANPNWFRSLRDQCTAAGVAFFYKQAGNWVEVPEDEGRPGDQFLICREHLDPAGGKSRLAWDEYPWRYDDPPMKGAEAGRWSPWRDVLMRNVGKKAAGRLLDGREWNEFPERTAA